jgi:hypothetical protein
MKQILILTGIVGLAALAIASSPIYKTMSKNGNAATPAQVIFPADPGSQIRIVNVNFATDTNNSTLSFSGGATAFFITITNALSSSVTNNINTTNGLTPSSVLVLQHAGVCYAATLASWNSSTNNQGVGGGTNVVLASGGWAVSTSVGDNVYQMDTVVSIPATATAAVNGDAIYVATLPGRPVLIKLSPALVTNQINSVTAHYD